MITTRSTLTCDVNNCNLNFEGSDIEAIKKEALHNNWAEISVYTTTAKGTYWLCNVHQPKLDHVLKGMSLGF